jgi:thiosulfate dehydrogenase [quinone] large subunit
MSNETLEVQGKQGLREQQWAYSLLRLALGINFCGHGFVRIFHGIPTFAAATTHHLAGSLLPHRFVYAYSCAIPVIEAILGTLLVLGLFQRFALVAGSLFMITLTMGVTSIQDWSTAGAQLLYSFVFFALLFLVKYDAYSLDAIRHRKRN